MSKIDVVRAAMVQAMKAKDKSFLALSFALSFGTGNEGKG